MPVLSGLDLKHLEALRAVAKEGTFGRAADTLGFTQSAISQQIAVLERIVGEPVFDRPGGPRPVRLTPVGRLVLGHADQILGRMELMDRELRGHRQGTIGRIDIGVFQSVAVKVLPEVVQRLRGDAPDIDVRPVDSDDDRLQVARVREGELDATFVGSPVREEDVTVVPLCDDPYVAVVPASDDGGAFPLAALGDGPLIGQPITDSCQVRIDAELREAGLAPDYVFRTGDNAALQSMVRAGMGTAVMPLLAVDANDPLVRLRPIDPPIPPRGIALVVGTHVSPSVERFVELAIAVCTEVSEAAPA